MSFVASLHSRLQSTPSHTGIPTLERKLHYLRLPHVCPQAHQRLRRATSWGAGVSRLVGKSFFHTSPAPRSVINVSNHNPPWRRPQGGCSCLARQTNDLGRQGSGVGAGRKQIPLWDQQRDKHHGSRGRFLRRKAGPTNQKTKMKGKAQPPQQNPSKKRKRSTGPESEVHGAIIEAAKTQDPALAVAAYDRAVREGIPMRPDLYHTLLFLAAGGHNWQESYTHLPIPWGRPEKPPQEPAETPDGSPPPSKEKVDPKELMQRGKSILAHLKSGAPSAFNEMCYTCLARIAAAGGDGDGAFQAALEGRAAKVPARLRTFLPSLLTFAHDQNTEKLFQVYDEMRDAGLELSETEYAVMLLGFRGGATRQQAEPVLQRMCRELTGLTPETVAAAKCFFSSPAADAWLEAGGHWQVGRCTVDEEGITSTCGGTLQALDLEGDEWNTFSEGVAKLAHTNEKTPDAFKAFQEWLQAHGPFGCIIDGANVALHGQNFEEGGFQFGQIGDVVETVCEEMPDRKPLVVLHTRRLNAPPAKQKDAVQLIKALKEEHMLYSTPYGSNDDWYWIYAAIKAGPEAMLVSNDEMRDHIFQLLAPRYFLRWKQRHQMKYKFTMGENLELFKPAKYTVCTQKLSTGSWVFPTEGTGEWLSACPKEGSPPGE